MTEITPSEIENLRSWIGKAEETVDVITPRLVKMLRAALFMEPAEPKVGDPVPWMMHWCFALDIVSASEIGPDGHPKRGGFLPPVPLPRRMWAGGTTEFVDRLLVGDQFHRRSEIADVAIKLGSTGQLCFVTINHTISSDRGVAIRESQNIVYRAEATAGAASSSSVNITSPKPTHQQSCFADPVLLFRYSAFMFNGHRIHYDRQYVTEVEGYGGLVVHGPLQASLLAQMAETISGKPLDVFVHRGVSPLFEGEFTLNAIESDGGLELWTASQSGAPAMRASASWRS